VPASVASSFSVQGLLRRDRAVLICAISLTTAAAWVYMVREAQGMTRTGVCECMGMAMGSPDAREWSVIHFAALFLMWTEMMVAMMLPTAAPMILMFASLNRKRRVEERPFVPTAIFVGGYVAIWSGFSLVAAVLQWGLHRAALLSPMMVSNNNRLAGVLFVCAGVFQFTRWKHSCLVRCANPLGFLLTEWRQGPRGAFIMGARHGAFCLGCCWFLMLLLFVFGVMNILWIAVLTLYVLIEKTAGASDWFSRVAGGLMCAAGFWTFWRAG
jgi:predicted metal-binding membrane protein